MIKLSAKSQFLGVMSHELRTPLNSVMGYSDLLLVEAKGPLNDVQRGYIARIQSSARHQLGLIEELLTYTRLEAGREELTLIETDVRRVIDDVVEFVRPEAQRKKLDVRSDVPSEPVQALTDPAKLRQIVLNLAGNAIKFTQHGEVLLELSVRDGLLTIAVQDTGEGIAEADAERVWEPFVQGGPGENGREGGTGLGLAIVRRLTAMLGGEVDFRGLPEGGTRFSLRLPTLTP